MEHRNIITQKWTRMAIDSLFDRGVLPDWKEFAHALRSDEELAKETLLMCTRHQERGSVELARVLINYFHPLLTSHEVTTMK